MHMSCWSFPRLLPWCGSANVLPWTDISSRMFILDRWAFVVAESVKVVSSLSMSALICVSFVYFQTLGLVTCE